MSLGIQLIPIGSLTNKLLKSCAPCASRYAVARATKRDVQAVVNCRDLVEGLMGEFLQVTIQLSQAHCVEAKG